MTKPQRPLAFIIASTDHGTMILNRFDRHTGPGGSFGAGYQLLDNASYDPEEVGLMLTLLDLRRRYHGDGILTVDCGANLGVHTVECAKHMTGWGVVLAFEAQERIYYALAGNVAINNCFNARVVHAAVSSRSGSMKIPQPNYLTNSSFGSLELKKCDNNEFIGQDIDYSEDKMIDVRMVNLDSFGLPRLDILKIDVEGMELEVLDGGAKCISEYHPIILVEAVKNDRNALRARLEGFGYMVLSSGMNFIAIHKEDKCQDSLKFTELAAGGRAA
jgi:FkbM family methyltransferase